MTGGRILTALFFLALITQLFYPLDRNASQASPEAFEGTGPVLQSRIIVQSAQDTFIKKKPSFPVISMLQIK